MFAPAAGRIDIREPDVLAAIDWDKLDEVAKEMPQNCLNDRVLGEFRHSYDTYVGECGPCSR